MKKIHIAPSELNSTRLGFLPGTAVPEDILFSKIQPSTRPATYTFDTDAESADYILAPHPVRKLDQRTTQYVAEMKTYAKKHNKPLIIFTGGDLQHRIAIDGVVLVKGAQYRKQTRVNEIQAPPYVEDLGRMQPIVPRKKGKMPIVGFCGWAALPSVAAAVRYYIRLFLIDIGIFFSGEKERAVFKRGLYFRKLAIASLSHSDRVETNFIIRNSFSGNTSLISVSPAQARQEYIRNMADSDFILAPKGDGNFSLRFYEALSMGRIPILIDTDVVLPLEEIISYDKCILRVPWQDTARVADAVADFYDALTPEEFSAMQRYAREVFENYLQYDAYLNVLFDQVVPETLHRMFGGVGTGEAGGQ